jgi:hypothetical protein
VLRKRWSAAISGVYCETDLACSTRDGKPSFDVDENRSSHSTFDSHLSLITLEHDARERLQHPDRRAGRDPQRRQSLGTPGQVAGDSENPTARSRTQLRKRRSR